MASSSPDGNAAVATDDNISSNEPLPKTDKGNKSITSRIKAMIKPEASDNEKDRDNSLPPVPALQLFAYSTPNERWLMVIACVAAAAHGTILPLFTIIFGSVINVFDESTVSAEDLKTLTSEIGSKAKWFLILGAVAFVVSLIQVRFQLVFAQRVGNRLRRLFFDSLMRQDYSWYDQNDGGELTARVASDVSLIEGGIGDKFSSAVQFMSMFVSGFIIAFVYSWKLTLVILAIAPLLAISGALFGKLAADSTSESLGAYGAAGGIANEVLNLIRTVTAFNGQETEAKRYEVHLQHAYRAGIMKSAFSGAALGFTYFVIFATFAVAFSFGAGQVRNESVKAGDVIVTFFSVFIATISIGQAAPAFNAFAIARGAAPRVYEVIRRQSMIDPLNEDEGRTLPNVRGDIEFRGVNFNYPTRNLDEMEDNSARPNVLSDFDLTVEAGKSQALVGSSGCGKSTTVRLIERFYDVNGGQIFLDGVDLRDLNVRWLRSQIGYVGQMPTLFMLSIRENIALGAAMEVVGEDKSGRTVLKRSMVTEEAIVEAAKMANAHDFIMKLPERYDTLLGERGALLSGGQKQRICIARALVRNPKILLLDESTSALDARSERIVQDALEAASEGRTTITIAHRLSTVKNADRISVIDEGLVAESGTHDELIRVEGGAYRRLVEYQNVEAKNRGLSSEAAEIGEGTGEGATKAQTESISKTAHLHAAVEEEELSATDKGVLKRAFAMNIKELPFIILGMIGGALAGASFPALAITFASVIDVLSEKDNEAEVRKWSLLFVLLGGIAFIGYFMQLAMLGISGERLTRKLRGLAFRSLLKQEIGFFDKKENSVGQLTSRLATEATLVKGITGDTLGATAVVCGTLLTGFLVAFLSCWRVALVVTVVFPFMAISEAAQVKLISGFDADSNKKFAQAGAVASEAVDNYDTVTAIGAQDVFIDRYNDELKGPLRTGQKTALSSGVAFGVAEFLSQALWAISFWVGSIFVQNGNCEFVGLMKAVSGLLFAGSALGQAAMFMPDYGRSKVAATNIFRLLDKKSEIDPTSEEGNSREIVGRVAADKVEFEYPSRADVPVLRGLSLEVEHGQTLALVGESGCGKSTIVSLIERMYDARNGTLLIDEMDIKEYEVKGLRQQMGIVSQEPDLFNRTVRDNIAYGLSHTDGTPVTDSMIEAAAKVANAHEFIMELSQGYDTMVGVRGSKLSGGQRQRVAIARSLVREPKILLLDEATSALDAVSERAVQQALEEAGKGRTTIAIAHRLSTIQDADVIAVVKRGKIVERGSHEELLENGEVYAKLIKNQLSAVECE